MIAYTVLLLFIIGAFSSIKVGVKADKVLAYSAFASLFFVFIQFFQAMQIGVTHTFSFLWNASQGQDLTFEIISNPYNYMLVFPCFVITVLAALHNLLFRYEERRAAYTAVLIFNLTSLILLLTSNNFVQLISALFVTDILAMFMLKNSDSCRRYCMLNMLADMVLFMVLAIINARVDSLEIHQILLYQKTALYPDFTSLAGLTAIFAKLGFFLFQIGIIGLQNVRFHRMQNVLFLSSPLAALILLIKFNALWRVSDYFTTYLDIMSVITGIWAFWGSIYNNQFKAKIIYLTLMFWSLMVSLLRCYGFAWIPEFSHLMIAMYVLISALYLLYFYNNRCRTMTQLMRLKLTHKKRLVSTLGVIMLAIVAAAQTLFVMYNNVNRTYILGFSCLFLITVSITLGQICFGGSKRNIGSQHNIRFKWSILLELTVLCMWLLLISSPNPYVIFGALSALVGGIIVFLQFGKISSLYTISKLQEYDFCGNFYLTIVRILRLSGRIFGLLIDHVFLERIVLGFAQNISVSGLRAFRRLHSSPLIGGTVVLFILGILIWFSYQSAGDNL